MCIHLHNVLTSTLYTKETRLWRGFKHASGIIDICRQTFPLGG